MVTIFGTLVTMAAAVLLSLGPRYWTTAGFVLLVPGACDMLDGAVARIGGRGSKFGGILDSTCDRIADVALFTGMGYYYILVWPAANNQPVNLTYSLLAILAMLSATLISYIRARARHEIADCNVGFWQRGERYAATVIGAFSHNVAMILWELGAAAALTALQRLLHARRVLAGGPQAAAPRGIFRVLKELVFFNQPRHTWVYSLYTGMFIALLIFVQVNESDLVRRLIEWLTNR
jgi:CDP-diacylglycerol--glycerol-3-phosphate 3-phosphatidyltransferase